MGSNTSKLPGPIIMIDQSEILSRGQVQFITLMKVHNYVAPFTSHDKLHEFGAEKPISWTKLAHFDFLQ